MDCTTENGFSFGSAREFDQFQDLECALSPPSAKCKTPEKINGVDVEIAVRKEPFKPFYPPRFKYAFLSKQPKHWPFKTVEDTPPVPKCSPRFFLKRIYQTLSRNVGGSTISEIISDAWSFWRSYEMEAADVFVYTNLDVVGNLILLFSISCEHFTSMQELFDKIMQRLQRGVYLGDASKELADNKKMTYFFSCIGLAIVDGHLHSQVCLANILSVWLENLINKRKMGTKRSRCTLSNRLMRGSEILSLRVPDYVLLEALEKSLLPTTVAKNITNDMKTEAYGSVLALLKLSCEASPKIRSRLWCLPILDKVLRKLSYPDPSNRILLKSIDFVYSYFGVYNLYKEEDFLPKTIPRLSRDAFQILLQRFLQQVETPVSASKSLLGLRNDTAFLICLIGKRVPFAGEYYRSYGFAIASLVTRTILGEDDPNEGFILESTPEDLELLQLMIFMLKCIVECGRGEKIIQKFNLVSVLMTMAVGPCGLPVFESDDPAKGKDVHNAAWTTVQAIAKEYPYCMVMQGGAGVLLNFLKRFAETGEGNEEILAMSLHTLRILLNTMMPPEEKEVHDLDDEDIHEYIMSYFVEVKAMIVFISVLNRLVEYEDFGEFQDTITSNALYCCSRLGMSNHREKEIFFDLDGVRLITMLLSHLANGSAERRNVVSVIQIAISECINSCIVYYPSALERFIELDGVLRILDVLEIALNTESILQLMNCILQLCGYSRCLQQLLCWKRPVKNITQCYAFGDAVVPAAKSLLYTARNVLESGNNLMELESQNKDMSLGSFLCSLWRDDEKRTEVQRDPDGCIASLSQPLMTKVAREYEIPREDDENGNNDSLSAVDRASIDMTNTSLRPKIYLLIKRIVESTSTTAALFDGLSVINQVSLQVIINFMDLKKCEVYTDLADEMQKHGFSFAPSDDEEASNLVTLARNKVATVLETQRYLLRLIKEKECMKETEFYSVVKQCRLQDHLMATREVDYLARTSNYQYLVEKRMWQKRELDEASRCVDMTSLKNSRVHRTSDGYDNVTRWNGRMKFVESEPIFRDHIFFGDFVENDYREDDDDDGDDDHAKYPNKSTASLMRESALSIHQTSSTMICSETCSNIEPHEGGYYQVSPYLLSEALKKLVSFRERNRKWIQLVNEDEENQWKVERKWKQNWYPLPKA